AAIVTQPAFYDLQKERSIECDVSTAGLGAVLLRDNQPIQYASRSLHASEGRYSQKEREMLSIIFALKRFHQYTFGRHTTVVNDHKQLQSIVRKQTDSALLRLQHTSVYIRSSYDCRQRS